MSIHCLYMVSILMRSAIPVSSSPTASCNSMEDRSLSITSAKAFLFLQSTRKPFLPLSVRSTAQIPSWRLQADREPSPPSERSAFPRSQRTAQMPSRTQSRRESWGTQAGSPRPARVPACRRAHAKPLLLPGHHHIWLTSCREDAHALQQMLRLAKPGSSASSAARQIRSCHAWELSVPCLPALRLGKPGSG